MDLQTWAASLAPEDLIDQFGAAVRAVEQYFGVSNTPGLAQAYDVRAVLRAELLKRMGK